MNTPVSPKRTSNYIKQTFTNNVFEDLNAAVDALNLFITLNEFDKSSIDIIDTHLLNKVIKEIKSIKKKIHLEATELLIADFIKKKNLSTLLRNMYQAYADSKDNDCFSEDLIINQLKEMSSFKIEPQLIQGILNKLCKEKKIEFFLFTYCTKRKSHVAVYKIINKKYFKSLKIK